MMTSFYLNTRYEERDAALGTVFSFKDGAGETLKTMLGMSNMAAMKMLDINGAGVAR